MVKCLFLFSLLFFTGCSLLGVKKNSNSTTAIKTIPYSDKEKQAHQKILTALADNVENFDKNFYDNLNYEAISSLDETLLHAASFANNNILIFDEIVARTTNIDRVSIFSKTPLTLAIENNDVYKAKVLLDKGANVNHLEFLSNPLFFIPLKNKNSEMFKLLLKYNFNPTQIGFMDKTWKEISTSNEIKSLLIEYERSYSTKLKEEQLKSQVIKKKRTLVEIINAN